MNISDLQRRCHAASYEAGWWHHPDTGLPYIPGDNPVSDGMPPWKNLRYETRGLIIQYWPFVLATKVALIHSEVSEGLEALRRGAMDDKLAHRLGLETELADSMIRTFDIGGAIERARALGVAVMDAPFDVSAAIEQKMAFNASRPDHTIAARRAYGGKAF